MSAPEEVDALSDLNLKDRLASILKDPEVKDGILERMQGMARGLRGSRRLNIPSPRMREALDNLGSRGDIGEAESIVLRTGRPVLFVQNSSFAIDDSLIPAWRERLERARTKLKAVIDSVGRINVANKPPYEWLGTGWLVRPDIVVTNRHVATEFAGSNPAGGFMFLRNFRRRLMSASIDFRMEHEVDAVAEFPLVEVLHIEGPDPAPDIAFLKISSGSGSLGTPIPLSSEPVKAGQKVAIIGYSGRDSRIPDPEVAYSIFGEHYDVKRLAPGEILGLASGIVVHDASTLGGNSGSAVIDLERGDAVGLHFAGSYLQANYAVPASMINSRLVQLGL
jgi:endonuclease G